MTLAELDAHEKGEATAVAIPVEESKENVTKDNATTDKADAEAADKEDVQLSPEVLDARRRDPHAGEQKHLFPCSVLCRKPLTPRFFLWSAQWGALQYVPIQIVMSILTFILHFTDTYHEGNISASDGYPYIAFIVNWSQIWAVYCLFWFYHSFQDELRPIRPFPKAMCIKGVVFLTFWQGVFINFLVQYGALHATENYTVEEVATGLQDFLICLEMFVAAVAHERYFGVAEWEDKMINAEGRVVPKPVVDGDEKSPKHGPKGPVLQRFYSFISPRDIAKDLKSVMISHAPKNRNSIDSSPAPENTVQPTPITSSSSSETTVDTIPAKPTATSANLE